MRILFTAIIGLLITIGLKAQDPRFSQFTQGPLHLNPAMNGVFKGSVRFNANYRSQWSSILDNVPFRTIGASADYRFRIVGEDYFALSADAMNDNVGNAHYTQTKAHLGFSYLKQMVGNRYRTDDQYIIVGAQIGLGQNSLRWSNLWFGRQWDSANEQINTSLNNGENIDERSSIYPDFNAGIMWYALYGDNTSIYAGAAMQHINSPHISFLNDGSVSLYRRWIGHAGGELPLNDQLSLLPSAMISGQGPSLETVFGTSFRYNNHDWREVALRAGVHARLANMRDRGIGMESVIFSTMLEMERMTFGLSYDVNTSLLSKATNGRGAFELSFIYIQPEKSRYKVNCPRF